MTSPISTFGLVAVLSGCQLHVVEFPDTGVSAEPVDTSSSGPSDHDTDAPDTDAHTDNGNHGRPKPDTSSTQDTGSTSDTATGSDTANPNHGHGKDSGDTADSADSGDTANSHGHADDTGEEGDQPRRRPSPGPLRARRVCAPR